MKLSLNWLRDYLDLTYEEIERIPEVLVQAGIEVDSVEVEPKGFSIVTIDRVEKHPNAERLNLCYLIGHSKAIVCGASNVRAGLRCILADVGSIVQGSEILARNIRGVTSAGMLCSAEELGLGSSDGLYEVKEHESLVSIFRDSNIIYTLSITANRGDLMYVYGLARELAAFGIGKLLKPNKYDLELDFLRSNTHCPINVDSDSVLSMYSVSLQNLHNNTTPEWMANRLKDIGSKMHNLIIDTTNYIAHALGQPLHAFDADIVDHISVERAVEFEFTDLKGKTHKLNNMTVMTNNGQCISLPGIIGGNLGKSSNGTRNILLEAANYTREHIYKGRKIHESHASKLFFHGIDNNLSKIALTEASAILKNIGKAIIGSAYSAKEYNPKEVEIKSDQVGLEALGFKRNGDSWIVPSWRHDVLTSEDLLEEYLRLDGYDKIPTVPFTPYRAKFYPVKNNYTLIKGSLCYAGFYEVVSSDLISKDMHESLNDPAKYMIQNYISESCYALRTSILQNLVETYAEYMRYKWRCPGIFEIGDIFGNERKQLGVAFAGENTWLKAQPTYLSMKSVVERFIPQNATGYIGKHPLLENVCEWRVGDEVIGQFGTLNQDWMEKLNIKTTMYLGSVSLLNTASPKVKETRQAVITRDVSVRLLAGQTAGEFLHKLRTELPEFKFDIFDLYPNQNLDQERALGVRFIFDQIERPLTTEELNGQLRLIADEIDKIGYKTR